MIHGLLMAHSVKVADVFLLSFFFQVKFFYQKSPEIIPNMTIYDKIYRAVFLKFACFNDFWIQQKLVFSL